MRGFNSMIRQIWKTLSWQSGRIPFSSSEKGSGTLTERAGNSSDLNLSKEQIFQIAYGREPSLNEIRWMEVVAVAGTKDFAACLRSITASFDRQRYPTPINVRLREEDIEFVNISNFELALDKYDFSVSRPFMTQAHYEPHLCAFIDKMLLRGMTAVFTR